MVRCILESYASVRPACMGYAIADAHHLCTVATMMSQNRAYATHWANTHVRNQADYVEAIHRDRADYIGPLEYLHNLPVISTAYTWAARRFRTATGWTVIVRGINGDTLEEAAFAYTGEVYDAVCRAAFARAVEWSTYGK